MASNFRISFHLNSDNLHLKLMGDFDGSSAHELINTLKLHRDKVRKIFIHTCSLSSIHPFGLDLFQKNCTIKRLSRFLTFTGEHGNTMALPGSNLL